MKYQKKNKSGGSSAQQPACSFQPLTTSLAANIAMFQGIFGEDSTIKIREFENQQAPGVKCCIFFVDGMIDNIIINQHIIEPIILNQRLENDRTTVDDLCDKVLFSNEIIRLPGNQVDTMLSEILSGNTILLMEGFAEAVSLSTRGWMIRGIQEPEAEKVMTGPREGFTEAIIINLSMIRRKICSPDLKFKFMKLGRQSQTNIALCYVEGLVDKNILKEMERRLNEINIDSIMDTNYVEELIKDSPYSPFKTTGSTERPDIVAAKLLEGRVAVIVDGTPVVLTAPYFFLEYFQTNDDYYGSFYMGTFGRWLRLLGFAVTLSLPAIYLAMVIFHPDLLPTRFILNLAEARLGLPFPTIFEMILLLLAFELIREGGAKVPANFGQTLSIVGGLILGQAAVDAKLVSIPVVIIMAFTGVTGLMIPHLKAPVVLLRLGWMILAAFFGFFGYLFGVIGLVIHLSSMKSFGIPYVSSLSSNLRQKSQDVFFRAPWDKITERPNFISPDNHVRQTPPPSLKER